MTISKYHGLGNDFIIVDYQDQIDYSQLAVQLCERKLSVGADGLIVCQKLKNKFKMSIYNADGSRARMCGNGIRCFANYLFDKEYQLASEYNVETDSGDMKIKVVKEEPFITEINMGKPIIEVSKKLLNSNVKHYLNQPLVINDKQLMVSTILMGPVHTVVFTNNLDKDYIRDIGNKISNHHNYPDRTNVNFVKVTDSQNIELLTYERGVGLTYACGTGSCASVVVGNKLNILINKVKVELPYGKLNIEIKKDGVLMQGPSKYIFKGEI